MASAPTPADVAADNAQRRAAQDARWTQVKYEKQGRVATVMLNRPKQRNTIGPGMSKQLDEALMEACADDEVRCIILTGAGDHFSSGHDLGTLEQNDGLTVAELDKMQVKWTPKYVGAERYAERYKYDVDLCLRWRDLPKPLICKVRGYCIYHAATLMSCADVIFAAEDAQIMPAHTQYYSFPYDIGVRKAKELLFAGSEFMSGAQAAEIGMVNRAVPAAELDKAVDEYVAKVVKQPSFTLRMYKQAVNQKDDQAGFQNYVKNNFSHWVLARDHTNVPIARPGAPKPRMIPKDQAEKSKL